MEKSARPSFTNDNGKVAFASTGIDGDDNGRVRRPAIDPVSGVVIPPVLPLVGSDVHPGPGAGMYPERADFGGGSMLLGPGDPRWFGGGVGGQPGGFPGGLPNNAPPGARFDPYGPPGVPGFEPNRFRRDMPRRGGGVHPDLEHFGGGP